MARVRLVLPEGLDDHERPKHRGVRAFVPPLTQMALWLYDDDRVEAVVRMNRMPDPDVETDPPADVVGAGHDWHGEDTDWQVAVLEAAGYSFVPDIPGLTYSPQEA